LTATADPSELEREARQLLVESDLDWVVANDRSSMGPGPADLLVLTRRGERRRYAGPKSEVAGKLLDDLGRELSELSSAVGTASRPRGGPSGRPRTPPAHRPSPDPDRLSAAARRSARSS
jgi:hypothetical protein